MTRDTTPRILVYSQRNISRALFHCPHYEFEDEICEIDSTELFAPNANPSTLRYRFAKRLAYHLPITMNPGIRRLEGRSTTICSLLFAASHQIYWPWTRPLTGASDVACNAGATLCRKYPGVGGP
jgi:hypothetical protein